MDYYMCDNCTYVFEAKPSEGVVTCPDCMHEVDATQQKLSMELPK